MILETLTAKKNKNLLGIIMGLLGIIILSPDALLIRKTGMDPWSLMAWRGFIMSIVFMLAHIMLTRDKIVACTRSVFTPAGWTIILSLSVQNISFVTAMTMTSAALVLSILATMPLFAALFSKLILKERVSSATWMASVFVIVGVLIVLLDGENAILAPDGNPLLGGLLALLTAAGIAFAFTLLRKNPAVQTLPAMGVSAFIMGCAGIWGAPVGGMMIAEILTLQAPDSTIIALILLGVIVLPVSFFLLMEAPRFTSAPNVSLIMLLEVVLGSLWVWLGTGERPGWFMMIGAGIIVSTLGIYILFSVRSESSDDVNGAS